MPRIEAADNFEKSQIGQQPVVGGIDDIILGRADIAKLPSWLDRPFALNGDLADQIRLINSEQQIAIRLSKINNLLKEHNLPLFSANQLRNIDARTTDSLAETKEVFEVGGGQCLAMIETDKMISDPETGERKLIKGTFGPIIETIKYHNENGARYLVLTDSDEKIPEGEIHGRIQIPKEMFKDINSQLEQLGRKPLSNELIQNDFKNVENTVKEVRFNPDQDKYPKYYSDYYVVMTIKTEDGREVPMVMNKVKAGKQGEIYTVRYTDNTWGFVLNTRPLLGIPVIETPRGYASDKFGGEFEQETGLDFKEAIKTVKQTMIQDPTYENVGSQFFAVVLDAAKKMNPIVESYRDEKQHELESLTPVKLSTVQVLRYIEMGVVADAFTLAGFGITGLISGDLILNKDYKSDRYIVLEEKFLPQLGKVVLTIPEGPIGRGRKLSEVLRNTGNSPTSYPVERGNANMLVEGRKYVKLHLNTALNMLKNGEFDNVTAATIVSGLTRIHAIVEAGY